MTKRSVMISPSTIILKKTPDWITLDRVYGVAKNICDKYDEGSLGVYKANGMKRWWIRPYGPHTSLMMPRLKARG